MAMIAAALLLFAPASAQFDSSTVLGGVRDSSGAVVPGASVTLKNTATGIIATAVTGSDGSYQFLNVRIGSYSVRAELQGFSAAEAKDVSVTVNARQRVDLTLAVGNVGETVEVIGALLLLETESSDRGQIIAKEQIINLPLKVLLLEEHLQRRLIRHVLLVRQRFEINKPTRRQPQRNCLGGRLEIRKSYRSG